MSAFNCVSSATADSPKHIVPLLMDRFEGWAILFEKKHTDIFFLSLIYLFW